jgi:hypothetical protein
MASISAIYGLGGVGALYTMEMLYVRRIVASGSAPPTASTALATAVPHRVLGGSGSVHVYARLLTSSDTSVRSSAVRSLRTLLLQMQTVREYQPRVDLYA